jgi:hypothetical protein
MTYFCGNLNGIGLFCYDLKLMYISFKNNLWEALIFHINVPMLQENPWLPKIFLVKNELIAKIKSQFNFFQY